MKQTRIFDNTCRKSIRGMIVPAQWDNRFEVTGVLIACRDEREIRIGNLNDFPRLKDLAQKEALFTGVIENDGTTETIFLESFTLIETEKG